MRRCILLTGAKYAVAGAIAAGAFVASTEIVRADGRAAPRGAPVVQQAPTSWSGFYFGAHSGWQWSQLDASVAGTSVFNVEHDSPVVGGQIGIQHQFGLFVVGIEGTLTVAYQDDHASTQLSRIPSSRARRGSTTCSRSVHASAGRWASGCRI